VCPTLQLCFTSSSRSRLGNSIVRCVVSNAWWFKTAAKSMIYSFLSQRPSRIDSYSSLIFTSIHLIFYFILATWATVIKVCSSFSLMGDQSLQRRSPAGLCTLIEFDNHRLSSVKPVFSSVRLLLHHLLILSSETETYFYFNIGSFLNEELTTYIGWH
jgi:hypothetical protein